MSRIINIYGSSYATSSWLPETTAYMTAVGIPADGTATVHGVTGLQLWQAVNTLFDQGINVNGWWARQVALYPNVGGSAGTIKWNAVNPLDTDAAFRQAFYGGVTIDQYGVTGNAVNAYVNTFLVPNTSLLLNTAGVTMSQRKAVIIASHPAKWIIGGGHSANSFFGFDASGATDLYFTVNDNLSGAPYSGGNFQGIFTENRYASNSLKLYKNASLVQSSTLLTGSLSTNPIQFLRLGLYVPTYGFSNATLQFVGVHNGMTEAETLAFHADIATFNTALNR